MNVQWIGLVAASATFFGVWYGHVAVRKIESVVERLWVPIVLSLILGLGSWLLSLLADNVLLSAAAGTFGVTLLWDSFEFWRQQKRIIRGRAPANPNNPRHARILTVSPAATTLDLLDRDPVGYPVSPEEAIHLIEDKTK
ncbi:MAG: DUF4491 family protein [Anaerolineales bacterium]|nr:DUF4491 family protein [Anaerolineales bacterium]